MRRIMVAIFVLALGTALVFTAAVCGSGGGSGKGPALWDSATWDQDTWEP